MPKVLHVISGLKVGGAEMMLHRLIVSARGGTYEHVVVSLDPVGEMRTRFEEAGIELVVFDFKHSPIAHFFRLVSLIRRVKPDIVQSWLYHADLLGGLAARMAGNRHVIWGIRTTDIRVGGSSTTAIVLWLCARFSRWIPQIIVSAAEASRQSHITAGYDAKKMVVVSNGYDFLWLKASADERESLREQCGIKQNDVVVGSLGRFHADKDQENFVRSAAVLAQQYPQLRFLMVGRDLAWDNTQLVDWIVSTGFKDRFVLLGERTDVPQCLVAMDIFCLHSRTEGFPNVLAEAMAMGLPCVTTDVGDAAMLLADAGVVVPKGNAVALALGVGKLLALEQGALHKLGMQAKGRVEAEFSMKRAREQFEDIYRTMLNKEEF
jgi:glycosyltransferase involved in cell wall biosynthesis